MSDEPMNAGELMMLARPFEFGEFDEACDDAVGRRTLNSIVADETEAPHRADAVMAAVGARRPPRRGVWSYGVSVAAVAAAIAAIIAVGLTGHPTHAPAANQPTSTGRAVAPSAPVSSAPSTVTRSDGDAIAQACVRDVRTTLRSMITAYQHATGGGGGGGGKAQALSQLRAVHAPSSIEFARDAAAFADWLARRGPQGKVTIAAVAGHACVQ